MLPFLLCNAWSRWIKFQWNDDGSLSDVNKHHKKDAWDPNTHWHSYRGQYPKICKPTTQANNITVMFFAFVAMTPGQSSHGKQICHKRPNQQNHSESTSEPAAEMKASSSDASSTDMYGEFPGLSGAPYVTWFQWVSCRPVHHSHCPWASFFHSLVSPTERHNTVHNSPLYHNHCILQCTAHYPCTVYPDYVFIPILHQSLTSQDMCKCCALLIKHFWLDALLAFYHNVQWL